QEQADMLAALRTERRQALLRHAEISFREGKKSLAEALLRPILRGGEDDDCRRKAEALLKEALQYKLSAEELYQKGKELFSREDGRGAYRAYRQLLEVYPQAEFVKDLKLPILVESLPPAAEVREITGQPEKRRLGSTPLMVAVPPG